LAVRQSPQLLINNRNHSIERSFVTVAPIKEQSGNFLWRGFGSLSGRSNLGYSKCHPDYSLRYPRFLQQNSDTNLFDNPDGIGGLFTPN
jgi:hypothetical protein